MRILFCCNGFLRFGGIQTMGELLCDHFQKTGHQCLVLTTEGLGDSRTSDFQVCYLLHQSQKHAWKVFIKRLMKSRHNRRIVRLIFESFKPDVCHLHFGPNIDDAFGIVLDYGVPMVVTLQSIVEKGMFSNRREKHLFVKFLESAVHVTCVSKVSARYLEKFIVLSNPVSIVYNGIKVNKPYTGVERKTSQLLFAGRLWREKGVDVLLDAIAFTQVEKVIIVGDGPDRGKLEAIASRKQLKHVEFVGAMDNQQVRSLMRESTFFVLSSRWEGFPLVALEAMAEGCPVVATNVGGVPELIDDGINGSLVPPENPQALAEAIQKLLLDPVLLKKMSHAAREKVKTYFSADIIADQYLTIYRKAITE